MDERRKNRRKVVNSRVRISHSNFGTIETKTRDISDSGVLILSNDELKQVNINDEIQLIFLDSGELDIIFNLSVVRMDEVGIGLKFLNYEKNGEVFAISDLRDVWQKQT